MNTIARRHRKAAPGLAMELKTIMRGAAVNGRALVAMTYLEAYKRFGTSAASYVWTLIEPAFFIGAMLVMRIYIKHYNPAFGESGVLFLLTGLLTFRMLRNTINKSAKAINSNRELFSIGPIKPIETIVAKVFVEYAIWLAITAAFMIGIHRMMQIEVVADFPSFVFALILNLYFCIALSIFNGTVGVIVPIWAKIWKIMTIPLLMLSGVIYIPTSTPPEVQAIIWWNPFLHCIEGLRKTTYVDYIALYDRRYLIAVSTAFLLVGLIIERLFRKEIINNQRRDDDDEEMLL